MPKPTNTVLAVMERVVKSEHGFPTHLIRFAVDTHWLTFRIWRAAQQTSPQERLVVDDEGADSNPTYKEDPEEAVPFMKGQLKWDGCCDLEFPGLETCMLHFCGPEKDPELGLLMREIYALGPEISAWMHGG